MPFPHIYTHPSRTILTTNIILYFFYVRLYLMSSAAAAINYPNDTDDYDDIFTVKMKNVKNFANHVHPTKEAHQRPFVHVLLATN